MNYRPWGYEPHGLTWLPYPAPPHDICPTLIKSSGFTKLSGGNPMPDDARKIANERIKILFKLAERFQKTHPDRAQRYAHLARRIASRNRVHIPRELHRRVCPGCKSYMGPSQSRTRVRQTREPHIAITCLRCGHITRIPLRSRKP